SFWLEHLSFFFFSSVTFLLILYHEWTITVVHCNSPRHTKHSRFNLHVVVGSLPIPTRFLIKDHISAYNYSSRAWIIKPISFRSWF
ncbi:unnamed protein product, partial [Brassica oleracea var. botrytis]